MVRLLVAHFPWATLEDPFQHRFHRLDHLGGCLFAPEAVLKNAHIWLFSYDYIENKYRSLFIVLSRLKESAYRLCETCWRVNSKKVKVQIEKIYDFDFQKYQYEWNLKTMHIHYFFWSISWTINGSLTLFFSSSLHEKNAHTFGNPGGFWNCLYS